MGGPLAGVRVVDCSAVISGPLCTQLMAEQGADVIKVEPIVIGDVTRPMGTQRNGVSAIFAAVNRGKRSLAIDLTEPQGLAAFKQLLKTADVFVQNFRPGAAERMGIGVEALRSEAPDVIYVSITGFGPDGPYAQKKVYDPLIQAASGIAWAQGQRPDGSGEPQLVRAIVCDKVTALMTSQAIAAALFDRARGGPARHVEVSMLDASIAFHWSDMMWNHSFLGEDGVVRTADLASMFRISATRDGAIVMVAGQDAEFRGVCDAFDSPERRDDPRFQDLLSRMHHIVEIIDWTDSEIALRTTAEVCALLDAHEVPCAPVNTLPELHLDRQIEHCGSIVELEEREGGAMRAPRPAAGFSGAKRRIPGHAPRLGEQSREVLSDAGLSADAIDALVTAGVVATGD